MLAGISVSVICQRNRASTACAVRSGAAAIVSAIARTYSCRY